MQNFNKILKYSLTNYCTRPVSRPQLYKLKQNAFSILISPKEARIEIAEKKPIVVHTSSLPKDQKKSIYNIERIPGARLIDLDDMVNDYFSLSRILPLEAEFVNYMKRLGINANDSVILYDDHEIVGATRVLWMMNIYGLKNVKIIDGGFNRWKEERKATENGEETWYDNFRQGGQGFEMNKELITNINEIRDYSCGRMTDYELVDARPPDSFHTDTSNNGGHIPFSKNIYYKLLLEEDGRFKQSDEIKKIFEQYEVDLSKNIICTCQTGVTATVLYAAMRIIGKEKVAVYDGSWIEWSSFPENQTMRRSKSRNEQVLC